MVEFLITFLCEDTLVRDCEGRPGGGEATRNEVRIIGGGVKVGGVGGGGGDGEEGAIIDPLERLG